MKLCECGCGQEVTKEGNRFIRGHHNRGKNNPAKKPEVRRKLSESKEGKNHPLYGKQLSEEHKCKISESVKGKNHPLYGKHHSEESRKKMSESMEGKYHGENNPNWRGGSSFEPYCPKFNNQLKEEIREQYNRKCVLCGKDEKDNITKSGKIWRLSIHHIDLDKNQGCNGKGWDLMPLCRSCHRNIHNKEN